MRTLILDIIDDKDEEQRTLEENLSFLDHHPLTTHSLTEATELLAWYEFSMLIVGLDKKGDEAQEILAKLRIGRKAKTSIVLTNQDCAKFRAACLVSGADGVFRLPMNRREANAQIGAILRRAHGFAQPNISIGSLEIDLSKRLVTHHSTKASLTRLETKVLELLLYHQGRSVTKENFLAHIYDGLDDPCQKIIDVVVCKLRQKLRSIGCVDLIQTVWGRGYRIDEFSAALKSNTLVNQAATSSATAERRLAATH